MNKESALIIKKLFISSIEVHITNRHICDRSSEILTIDNELMLAIWVHSEISGEVDPITLKDMNKRVYELFIEEITPNTVGFKHNHAQFLRDNKDAIEVDHPSLVVHYARFKGYERREGWSSDTPTTAEYYDTLFPQLGIKAKYDQFKGVSYAIILLEFTDAHDLKTYCGVYTKDTPDAALNRLCMRTIKKRHFRFGESVGDLREQERWFASYANTGISIQKRLEDRMRYSHTTHRFKTRDDARIYTESILEKVQNGQYSPTFDNSWKRSEKSDYDRWRKFTL